MASRVADPTDGQVPLQPWARKVQEELLARRAPAGIPQSCYGHRYEIPG
jgi:hypothetical protein